MKPAASPRKSPRQARSRATVQALLDATARILVSDPHGSLTTNAVAERAGVSIGSLYQYFPDKAALLEAVRSRHAMRMDAAVARAFERPASGRDGANGAPPSFDAGLAKAIDAVVQAHLIDPDLHHALERHVAGTAAAHAIDASLDVVRSRLADVLTRHRASLAIEDPTLAAFVVTQSVHAVVHEMVRVRPAGTSIKRLTREVFYLVKGYLVCPR